MSNGNTYKWEFPFLRTKVYEFGKLNVVKVVYWFFHGTNSNETYTTKQFGQTALPDYIPGSGSFVEYKDLTPQILETWVLENMPPDRYGKLTSSIDLTLSRPDRPPNVFVSPPWSSGSFSV